MLGGSFNPIHHGHLLMADEVLEALGLDRVVFVPAAVPPHKPAADLAPAADRYEMVRLAVAGHPGFAVSDVELSRPGPSYTVDTLATLAAAGDALFLVLGSETFLDLLAWREPRRVAALARLVVVPRAGSAFAPESAAAQKVLREAGVEGGFADATHGEVPPRRALIVRATSLPISGSDLRRRFREGRSVAYRMPPEAAAYARARGLYRAARG